MSLDPRPPLDLEARRKMHSLLGAYMKDREADAIIHILSEVMNDPDDGPRLVVLFQEWISLK